jgi:hypothetical protein
MTCLKEPTHVELLVIARTLYMDSLGVAELWDGAHPESLLRKQWLATAESAWHAVLPCLIERYGTRLLVEKESVI